MRQRKKYMNLKWQGRKYMNPKWMNERDKLMYEREAKPCAQIEHIDVPRRLLRKYMNLE
jgi:hypothetical protein